MSKKSIMSITPAGIKRIAEVMNLAPKGTVGLRVTVAKGGCSGYKYDIGYATEHTKLEEVIDLGFCKVIVSATAIMMLIGATMDYKTTKLSSSFEFDNPNETGRCGCGESFII